MATKAQIRANRRNAQKSAGPRTPEGKAVVSQNAVTHGLTTRQDVISSESQAEFDLYRDAILGELAPVSPMESMLAERIVSLSWRLKRAGRVQNQTIDAMNADRTSNPLAKLTQTLLFKAAGQPQPDPSALPREIGSKAGISRGEDGDLALGRLAIKDFSHGRVLERLLMYERRIEHSLYKTLLELQRLLVMRKLNAQAADGEQIGHEALLASKFSPIIQNKANFPAGKIQVNSVLTKDYQGKVHLAGQAKQSQTNPISTAGKSAKTIAPAGI